MIIIFVSQARS